LQEDWRAGNTVGMARQSTDAGVPVLLTRPKAQAQAFSRALSARFGARVRPVVAPLMRVEALAPDLPGGPFAAVIFTSANGVDAARALRPRLPDLAWCVGDRTAAAARAAGFAARSAAGDAGALVRAVLADPPPGRLLHLTGAETRGDIAQRLASAGLETLSAVIYRQVALPLPGVAQAVLAAGGPVILPLFSPESARRAARALAAAPRADLRLVAMSDAVALAAGDLPRAGLWLAARPDAEAMLQAVGAALESVRR
jgi:uroporphyrinogen-III synthase